MVSEEVKVGGNVTVIAGERGGGVRVADGLSVFVGWGIVVDVNAMVGVGAGANIRFAKGGPNTPVATAINASANDATSHCQPVTMRA